MMEIFIIVIDSKVALVHYITCLIHLVKTHTLFNNKILDKIAVLQNLHARK